MKYIVLTFIFLFNICSGESVMTEDNITIDGDILKIKYRNFKPKQVDEACLAKKMDKLFKIIEISRRESPHQLPPKYKFYPNETMKITKKEIIELSNQLVMQKHISTKGNREWRDVISHKHLVIEDQKKHIYMIYPLEPSMFIMSGISLEKIKEGESILVRGLKHWINMKECMKF